MFQIWLNSKPTHPRALTSVRWNKHKQNNTGARQNQIDKFSDIKKHLKSELEVSKKEKKGPIMYK